MHKGSILVHLMQFSMELNCHEKLIGSLNISALNMLFYTLFWFPKLLFTSQYMVV